MCGARNLHGSRLCLGLLLLLFRSCKIIVPNVAISKLVSTLLNGLHRIIKISLCDSEWMAMCDGDDDDDHVRWAGGRGRKEKMLKSGRRKSRNLSRVPMRAGQHFENMYICMIRTLKQVFYRFTHTCAVFFPR